MNKEYLRALIIAEKALKDMDIIYDNAECEEFEDVKAYKAMEKLIEDIDTFVSDIKHYSKDTKQGYLRINNNNRYIINDIELSSGFPIEVYNVEYQEWEAGRIEHSSKYGGYYFKNYDGNNIVLSDGIIARIRV